MDGTIDQKIQQALSNNKSLQYMGGGDFVVVADTNAKALNGIYKIRVIADAVFNVILVNGVTVVAAKGLTGVTVPAGTELPFVKENASSVTLTSGKVILYI